MSSEHARLESELKALVAIPSITGEEEAVQDLVAKLLADAGLVVERLVVPLAEIETDADFPGIEVERTELPIVAGRLVGNRPGPTLIMCGHVDVVPPGDPVTWTTPAFEPEVRDGSLYGRGAVDMKGGLLSAVEAIRSVVHDDLAGEVILLAVPSEEDGGSGALAAIRAGYVGDACIITEPTNLDMVVAHGGAITFTLGVPGKAAHASLRREGVSALDNLSYLVEALKTDEAARNAAETRPEMAALGLPYPTIIGQVEGGNWASTVMDGLEAHGRYGVTLGQNCDDAGDDLRAAIKEAAAEHEFMGDHPPSVTTWGGRFDSSSIDAAHPLPKSLQAAAEAIGAHVPQPIGAPYGADMRLFINQGQTPTIMYGPGLPAVAHAADEHVAVADVAECAAVLAAWIRARLAS